MGWKLPQKSQCGWFQDRLPLLQEGDLPWAERRKVERHLIGCKDCRDLQASHQSALSVLHSAAAMPPFPGAAAREDQAFVSIWPALARQIQDAKHDRRELSGFSVDGIAARLASRWQSVSESFVDLVRFEFDKTSGSWLAPELRPVPVAMAALLIVSVGVMGVGSWLRWNVQQARIEMVRAAHPIFSVDPATLPRLSSPVSPVEDSSLASLEDPSKSTERPTPSQASRFNFDLDRGTPMGPNAPETKSSY